MSVCLFIKNGRKKILKFGKLVSLHQHNKTNISISKHVEINKKIFTLVYYRSCEVI